MRLLLNECIVRPITLLLRNLGHDIVHIDELRLKGSKDEENLNLAIKEGRVFVTQDRDFAKWNFNPPQNHPGIVCLRMDHKYLNKVQDVLKMFFSKIIDAELRSSIIIVRFDAYEIRRLGSAPVFVSFKT